jgi:deoxycytidine triphosphate deaminase
MILSDRDIKDAMTKGEVSIDEDEPFILHPGEFALGMIYEKTGVSDAMVGRKTGI